MCEYTENHDNIPFSVLQTFSSFFPAFEEYIKAKGYALSEADLVRIEYMQARAPHANLLCKIENASPDILYMKVNEFLCTRNKSQFVPFARFEIPKEASYFLDALCTADNQKTAPSDVQYAFFKAHLYTNLVHTYLEHFPPSYCYIEEADFKELQKNYPELATRFETEAKNYIESLGYEEAIAKYAHLQREETLKLSKLTMEQVSKPIKLRIGNRQVTIDYQN